MADSQDSPRAAGENTPEEEMQSRLEDLMTRYLMPPVKPERQKEHEELLIAEIDQLFEDFTDDQDKLALFGFFPLSLTRRHVVTVLAIERKLGQSQNAQNLRDLVGEMEWGSVDEKRKALLYVHDSLREREDPDGYWQRESHTVLVQLLGTFGAESTTKVEMNVEELAARAVLNHFRLGMRMGQRPDTWIFDAVYNLAPVAALQTSRNDEYRLLYELFSEIFAMGQCRKFMTFYAKNKDLVEKRWQLPCDQLTQQVRILTLCTLCVRSTESLRRGDPAVVPYAKIAEALCIELQDVERYVIEARSLGLLNAKIDAMGEAILVKSAHHALLCRDDWRRLREKLHLWREASDKLMIILDDVRMQQVKEDRELERMEAMDVDRLR